jgi:S-formylglutathione hydrolase FrmB
MMGQLERRAEAISGEFKPQNVANTLWAIRFFCTQFNVVPRLYWSFGSLVLCLAGCRPEREAHGLAGTSMGGAASYHLGIKHNQFFKNIAGISPPLNLRYMDHKGSYMGDFSAAFTEFRTDFSKGHMTVGKFCGFFLVKAKDIQADLFNFKDPNIAAEIAAVNPTEMLDFYNIKNGMLNMYLAYGRKDEFNLDAQAESFLHHAQAKGIHVDVDYDPHGKHNTATAKRFIPNMIDWFAIQFKGMEPK